MIHPSMSPEIYESIGRKWLPYCNGNYLEIGSWTGGGISTLAEKFPNKNFYSIEPFIQDKESRNKFLENCKELKNIFLIEVKSDIVFSLLNCSFLSNRLSFDSLNIDTMLIDGSHIYADVLIDIDIAKKILYNKVGLLFFHDALNTTDVLKAVDEFEEKYKNQILFKDIDGDGKIFITNFK